MGAYFEYNFLFLKLVNRLAPQGMTTRKHFLVYEKIG